MAVGIEEPTKADTAEENFLGELRSEFDKEIDLRKNLDNKANTMITVASAVSTVLIAIGTFLISRIFLKNIFYDVSIIILGIGIGLAVTSIGCFIGAYSVREYLYPMGAKSFFDNKGGYNERSVEAVRNLDKKKFNDKMFRGYILCIKKSGELNHKKAIAIKWGQAFLTSAIIDVAILITFILVSMGFGTIRLG